MFKSARWRSEKNKKIQAVFKLQFHATQLAQVGEDALMLSYAPADVGKPIVRLEKSAIRDGCCYWENPVYETVKFFREPKTGKIHEKIYNIVVSTGSSKAGFVGEVSIDFASYAESTKLSSVSLPLKDAISDAVLHVSIQRLQENIDQREGEEIVNTKINSADRSLKAHLSICDADGTLKSNSTDDVPLNKTISHISEFKRNHRTSSGSDLTLSSSESSSGFDTPREFGLKSNNIHQEPTSFPSTPNHNSLLQKTTSDVSATIYEEEQRSQWEGLGGCAPEVSTDEASSSPRNALLGEKSREDSNIIIEKLKTELAVLSRQADMSGLELLTLRKQIVKESKRGQELFREFVSLKEERDAIKEEYERLKDFEKRMDEVKVKDELKFEGGDPHALVEELRQELNYEKDLSANLRIQLQKTQESNSELILAVRDLDEMLEQKNRETFIHSNRCGELQEKALEELVMEHSDANGALVLEQKIMDLHSKLETYRRDKDELEVQMEQLALDYEIMKQENHDLSYKLEQSQLQEQLKVQYECSYSYASINEIEAQVENLESELKMQSNKFSDSLVTISKLETHVKDLEEELEKQAQAFEADLEILTRAKVEQEQRAIRAEEALRKMRWQNANTAEKLQEEFRRLSVQMASTFEANEKFTTKKLTEASELHQQKSTLEELLQKAKKELESVRDDYEAKLLKLSDQISLKVNHIEHMESEIEAKSEQLERGRKHGEETHRVLSQEIVFLKAEIERLKTENNNLFDEVGQRENLKGELEQLTASMKETEILLQRGNTERDEMESAISLLRKELEKSMEELKILRSLKDEKESIIGNLQLELETLKSECNELKHSLFEDEFEKEKLRKQVIQLEGYLEKEDVFRSFEKKLADNDCWSTVSDGTKTTSGNIKAAHVPHSPKERANLKDKTELLENQIKLKETALESSTDLFLVKEKDLQSKIRELEGRLEEVNQDSANFHEYEFQKVAKDSENISSIGSMPDEVKNTAENLTTTVCISNENGSEMPIIVRNVKISSEKEINTSDLNARDEGKLGEILSDMASLRETNKTMEGDLREMQERYSELSLKFAEVEGERHRLLMKVRNLKNARKS